VPSRPVQTATDDVTVTVCSFSFSFSFRRRAVRAAACGPGGRVPLLCSLLPKAAYWADVKVASRARSASSMQVEAGRSCSDCRLACTLKAAPADCRLQNVAGSRFRCGPTRPLPPGSSIHARAMAHAHVCFPMGHYPSGLYGLWASCV
jgi:hypothetical protein